MLRAQTASGTFEIAFYVVCAAITAIMLQWHFRSGHPPIIFWPLFGASCVGIERIFAAAWREDRRAQQRR
ncbi:MAG: hypothetical protein M3126_06230 [Candidatus Eremiobacteraeota bacterium]|nr:hypothetical protein [Candidatus Eremiobacteraeota bacterium]